MAMSMSPPLAPKVKASSFHMLSLPPSPLWVKVSGDTFVDINLCIRHDHEMLFGHVAFQTAANIYNHLHAPGTLLQSCQTPCLQLSHISHRLLQGGAFLKALRIMLFPFQKAATSEPHDTSLITSALRRHTCSTACASFCMTVHLRFWHHGISSSILTGSSARFLHSYLCV